MKFSSWLDERVLSEGRKGGKSSPVQMPKEYSNVIGLPPPKKQRMAAGRRDTTFGSKETRGEKNKKAIDLSGG